MWYFPGSQVLGSDRLVFFFCYTGLRRSKRFVRPAGELQGEDGRIPRASSQIYPKPSKPPCGCGGAVSSPKTRRGGTRLQPTFHPRLAASVPGRLPRDGQRQPRTPARFRRFPAAGPGPRELRRGLRGAPGRLRGGSGGLRAPGLPAPPREMRWGGEGLPRGGSACRKRHQHPPRLPPFRPPKYFDRREITASSCPSRLRSRRRNGTEYPRGSELRKAARGRFGGLFLGWKSRDAGKKKKIQTISRSAHN